MTSKTEMKWIIKQLNTGKMDAIAAFRTITALKNQQDHIEQLQLQLKNNQKYIKYLETRLGQLDRG